MKGYCCDCPSNAASTRPVTRLHRDNDLHRPWHHAVSGYVHQLRVFRTGASVWRVLWRHQKDERADDGQEQAHGACCHCTSASYTYRVSYHQPYHVRYSEINSLHILYEHFQNTNSE